jgi:ribonuclease P protein component
MLVATEATEKNTASDTNLDSRFRRRSRLADKPSFGRVFKGADRSRDKMFTVLYRLNATDEPRLGLAIGKKNCRLASGRNRLKRIIRESFRHHQNDLPGLDIVVLNQPAAARANNDVLFGSLQSHWQRCCRQTSDEAGKS